MTSPKPTTPTDEAVSKQTMAPAEKPENKPATEQELDEALADAQAKFDTLLREAQDRASKKPFHPHVAPGSDNAHYKVLLGDSLDSIAIKLHLASPYHDLFQANMDVIETAAKTNGHPGGSDQGSVLVPGTWLEYRLPGGRKIGE